MNRRALDNDGGRRSSRFKSIYYDLNRILIVGEAYSDKVEGEEEEEDDENWWG